MSDSRIHYEREGVFLFWSTDVLFEYRWAVVPFGWAIRPARSLSTLSYSRFLAGIPILVVFQNLRWNSNKTSLQMIKKAIFGNSLFEDLIDLGECKILPFVLFWKREFLLVRGGSGRVNFQNNFFLAPDDLKSILDNEMFSCLGGSSGEFFKPPPPIAMNP